MAETIVGVPRDTADVPRPIRLLIIDDSLVARTALGRMVEGARDVEVVATAHNAEKGLEQLREHRVDVILLDLDMPGMGGLAALPAIIERSLGARILVVSSLTVDGAEHTLQALSLGAADTLAKPDSRNRRDGYRQVLLGKIRALGRAASAAKEASPDIPGPPPALRPFFGRPPGVLAIGASTGGIHALTSFFAALPRRLNVPVLITQHLPAPFIPAFARQLENASGCETLLAEEDMALEPGRILVAPGNASLALRTRAGRLAVRLDDAITETGCMPSVDPMFSAMAEEVGDRAMGVVLSGMGRDGAIGAARIVAAGGSILAQDEESSAVWGMPGAVAEAGLASAILPPGEIASRVVSSIGWTACR